MIQLKAALLDDNKEQLLLNQQILESTGLITIVLSCTHAIDFMADVANVRPDILFLDINLGDSYMTGMEVAFKLQIPTMFVSSNVPTYIKEIEKLKRDYDICVDHITKPFIDHDFKKTTERFLKEIQFFANQQFIYLDFGSSKRNKIDIKSIVYLSSEKQYGSENNNKQIHFIDRKSETLIDFSFSKMEEKGFPKLFFITIHGSFRVNKLHISKFDKKAEKVEVVIFSSDGKTAAKYMPVSENYSAILRKIIS